MSANPNAAGISRRTIYVISGGRQGQQVIRVVPDYQGSWTGRLLVTSCTQTGIWAQLNFYGDFPVNSSDPFGLALSQSGESLDARVNYGTIVFPTVPASITGDGSSAFLTTYVSSQSSITIEGSWNINSPRAGELTGTVAELWRVPGVSGEARLVQTIVNSLRGSTSALTQGGSSSSSKARAAGAAPLDR